MLCQCTNHSLGYGCPHFPLVVTVLFMTPLQLLSSPQLVTTHSFCITQSLHCSTQLCTCYLHTTYYPELTYYSPLNMRTVREGADFQILLIILQCLTLFWMPRIPWISLCNVWDQITKCHWLACASWHNHRHRTARGCMGATTSPADNTAVCGTMPPP
jgi:hypothetical protein